MVSRASLALLLMWLPACSCERPPDELGVAVPSKGGDDQSEAATDPLPEDAGDRLLDESVTAVGGEQDADNALFEGEVAARLLFAMTPIALSGRVVDELGSAVGGARLQLGNEQRVADADGAFEFEAVTRRNALLRITASGYREELVYVHLARPVSEPEAEVDDVQLLQSAPGRTRLLFGGDTSFGRRFIDPEELADKLSVPDSDPTALIDAANPLPGTRRAMAHVRDLFRSVDFGSVNLETPVTASPSEYHTDKQYSFFSLPESLAVFPWLGVQYVALGNNHVFDYLTDGVSDTLQALDERGIATSGAGLTVEQAFAPHRMEIAGQPFSLISMTSVSGSQNPPLYVATADPPKGGAADLRDDERVTETITAEVDAGRIPIVQLHTGQEYTFEPSQFASNRMSLTVASGAALVIAHHPHVAQGFGFEDGVLIAHSLGNLCFDQARLETMLGLMAQVDMEGARVLRAVGRPMYLEDYTPRPVVGDLAEYLVRRIGEVSVEAAVRNANGLALVAATDTVGGVSGEREQTLSVELDQAGVGIVDLRGQRRSGESLASARVDGATFQWGEDLLGHGDFEDWDVDDDQFELSRWDVTGGSSFPCLSAPYRGAVSLCSVRDAGNQSNSVIPFRNRVRVLGEALGQPNKDLSLVGYVAGDNAGALWIEAQYYASVGDRQFDRETVWQHPAGSYDWEPFSEELRMAEDDPSVDALTANPHALRLFIFHEPPHEGKAIARLDDLAVVSWRRQVAAEATLKTPNPVDFIRVRGSSGKADVTLVWRKS